jgi:hypothetical protein
MSQDDVKGVAYGSSCIQISVTMNHLFSVEINVGAKVVDSRGKLK